MSRALSGGNPTLPAGIPVLVLDGSWTLALRTVRALGRTRTWDIHLIADRRRAICPAGSSRYVRSSFTPKADEGSDAWWDEVLDRAKEVGARVLFPLCEESSLGCIRHRERIERVTKLVPLDNEDTYRVVIDKGSLARHLAEAGLPFPKSVHLRPTELDHPGLREIRFPLIVKPTRGAFGNGIKRVENPAELMDALASGSAEQELLVQEFIEGSDADCSFIAVGGELVVSTTQKSNTPDSAVFQASGNVHVDEIPDLTEAARDLVRSLNFTGIANVDFRWGTDGKPYLLEVNARIWASLLASVAAGVNFPDIFCRLALGLPVHVPDRRSIHFSTLGLGLCRTLRHPFRAAGSTPRHPLTELGLAMRDPLPELFSRLRVLTRRMNFPPAR